MPPDTEVRPATLITPPLGAVSELVPVTLNVLPTLKVPDAIVPVVPLNVRLPYEGATGITWPVPLNTTVLVGSSDPQVGIVLFEVVKVEPAAILIRPL